MTPRRILFIIDWFHRTGGTEKHLAQLIAGLKAWAFESSLVVFDRGDNPLLETAHQSGVPVIHLPVGANTYRTRAPGGAPGVSHPSPALRHRADLPPEGRTTAH